MQHAHDLDGAILIVEDNYALRVTLASVLEDTYPVITASNGVTAIQLLQRPPRPALILLDLMVPILSGWEVLAYLQGDPALAQIPVVVLSAIADDPSRPPDYPVAASVTKPVDLDTLLTLVERFYVLPALHHRQ